MRGIILICLLTMVGCAGTTAPTVHHTSYAVCPARPPEVTCPTATVDRTTFQESRCCHLKMVDAARVSCREDRAWHGTRRGRPAGVVSMGRDEINSAIFFGVVMAVFSLCEGVNGTKDSWYSCALCGLPMSFFLPL